MPTKIDEWSRLLGNIETELKGLNAQVSENRRIADDRHDENKENFKRIELKVDTLNLDATQDRAITASLTTAAQLDGANFRKELGEHDDRIKVQERFHDRFGGIVWVVVTFVVPAFLGAVYLLWQGAAWLLGMVDLKALWKALGH